ncbi:MAG: crossover junction endodeoxyribonuclease RuvC [Phycisphaerales bacterium]|nr:crossover junction endodeoxyribonuclease RuvC [Phycisphaerales bacterium]
MLILGIDPGLRVTGYACLDTGADEPRLVEAGVIRLGRDGARNAATIAERLVELDADLSAIFARLRPAAVAVEAVFAHPKHPATAITMGHARGVILLCVRRAGPALIELRPGAVKKFLTGNGQAGKAQMQDAVQARLRLVSRPEPADVADAIAIALCAACRGHLAGAGPFQVPLGA